MTTDHSDSPRSILLVAGLALVAVLASVGWWLFGTDRQTASEAPDPLPRETPPPAAVSTQAMAIQAIATAQTPTDIYIRACTLCHGSRGEGSEELRTPSIAGQPAWYVRDQLHRFRDGRRGGHPNDQAGQQMTAIARALPEASIDPIARTISGMPPFPTLRTLAGDVENGRLVYAEQCMECHRFNGQGELVFRSSPLTSFQDWYLAREFDEFRTGLRGLDPQDRHAAKMRDVALYLDAKSRRDVIAYIVELASEHPPGK